MKEIAPGVLYLTRADWGAQLGLPRLGERIAPTVRTEAIFHHTVVIDSDATPNLWETLSEVKVKMQQLQTIRPDLGLDVPYNFVVFLITDGSIVLCEGRGAHRRGAHTKYHNRTGIGVAIEGNLDLQVDVGRFVEKLSWAWGWIKEEHGLVNLGSVRPSEGEIWGHQDFAQTACPGISLVAVIKRISITAYVAPEPEEEEDMKPYLVAEQDSPYIFIAWGNSRSYLRDFKHADALGIPRDVKRVPKGTLKSLGRVDS